MEEKLDEKNVQIAQVLPKSGYKILSDAELKELIAQIEPAATEGGGDAAAAPAAGAGASTDGGATAAAAAAPNVP